MKKTFMNRLAMFSTAFSVLALAACGNAGDETASSTAGSAAAGEENVKLGLITATTGGAAAYGISIKEGAELAVEKINAEGGAQIDLLIEDEKGDKNEAINAMNKLVHKDNVLAVQGPMLSGTMFAAGPIAQQAGIVALGTSTTADGITDIGDYIFRNAVPEKLAVSAAVKKSHEALGYKTVGIMYSQNNDQMVSVYNTLEAAFAELGVEVVAVETFADGDTDFSAQLTKIKEINPDMLAVASLYQEGALIMKKARSMGIDQQVIGSNGFNSPELLKQAGEAADGVIVGTPWFPGKDSQIVKDFREAYVAKYEREPDQFAAQAYDGINLLYTAYQNSGSATDRAAFRDALAAIEDFEGVTGEFQFDENRDPQMEIQVLTVEDGKFVELTK